MPRPLVHVLTPGDHFSPRTGSAVPTVVHGLSQATPADEPRAQVLVADDTYPERYPSADALTYRAVRGTKADRYVDAALGRLGLPRVMARRKYAAGLADQRSWPPSVVLAHNAVQAVPIVGRQHHAVLYAHNVLLRSYSRREVGRALRDVAAIVCVSDSLRSETDPYLPPELRDRVRVVVNGVDSAAFAADPGRPRGEALEVMFVGRMTPYKGADVLVDAVARLNRRDVSLTLVGGAGFSAADPLTPFEKDIRDRAARLPGPVDVRPFVPRSEVAATLARADIVVVPSRWPDPCPLTVLEGMAAGAALVASRVGGIPEQIGDAGIGVEPGDPDALAEVIAALADDEALLTRTRTACRAHAVANDWTVVRQRLVAALGPLLN